VSRGDVILEKEFVMSRNLLMESLLGHLALLERRHPKKAASTVARRLKRHISRSRRAGS
jgi:hypothetical protein